MSARIIHGDRPADYALRRVPRDIHTRALARARSQGLELREVLIALMQAYGQGHVSVQKRAILRAARMKDAVD